MTFELVGVPFSSMARPGGIAEAIAVLREEGLARAVDAADAGDLELIAGDGVRGPSGLLNEAALVRLVVATRDAVLAAHGRGRLPLLVGGDCPVLLGALAAGRDLRGTAGLLHVDGHEDAWPPERSPTGEASDSEVAIALGRVRDLPEPLAGWVPLVTPDRIAMLGPRDAGEIAEAGVGSLREAVALFLDDAAIHAAGTAAAADRALAALAETAPSFWLHVDLDVLRSDDMSAVDYPQPGGLTWPELEGIAGRALASAGCLGASVVIYNPDLDPERTSARRIVRFVSDLVG